MNEKNYRKEMFVFFPIYAIYFCTKCECNNFDFNKDYNSAFDLIDSILNVT